MADVPAHRPHSLSLVDDVDSKCQAKLAQKRAMFLDNSRRLVREESLDPSGPLAPANTFDGDGDIRLLPHVSLEDIGAIEDGTELDFKPSRANKLVVHRQSPLELFLPERKRQKTSALSPRGEGYQVCATTVPDDDSSTDDRAPAVTFKETVKVQFIPSRWAYSEDVRLRLWSSTDELNQNAERNHVEFLAEGLDWQAAIEEGDMIDCGGERIHPAHLDDDFPERVLF